jgi:secretion/DNA translocation related TadE-like protein
MSERGSASLLGAAVIAVTLLLGLAGASAAGLVGARLEVQAAADAAALAAAPLTYTGGDPAAEAARFAAANGARLVSCECRRDPRPVARVVTVVVEAGVHGGLLGRVTLRAEAQAEYVP